MKEKITRREFLGTIKNVAYAIGIVSGIPAELSLAQAGKQYLDSMHLHNQSASALSEATPTNPSYYLRGTRIPSAHAVDADLVRQAREAKLNSRELLKYSLSRWLFVVPALLALIHDSRLRKTTP